MGTVGLQPWAPWDTRPPPGKECQHWVQFVGQSISVHWELESGLVVLENTPDHPAQDNVHPNQGDQQTLGTERVTLFWGSYVHLLLWAHLKSWPFPKSGAHLLRSVRCVQNARSCSGRRNSQTPGVHYCYLCFHLTKDSPGRKDITSSKHSLIGCPFPKGQVLFPVA